MNNQSIRIRSRPHTDCDKCPVRHNSLFEGFSEGQLQWTRKYRHQQFIVPAKRRLYLEGSNPDYVYTVFDGWMALYHSTDSGKRQILRFVLPGDYVGFHADGSGVVSHSASALTEAVLCGYPRVLMQKMFSEQPSLALRLASMEGRDINLYQQHLMFAGRKDAYESVSFLLLELFHRTRRQMPSYYDEANNSIYFPITQEDIGDAVGLTNVHVNRVLRQFVKDGLLECRQRKLSIIDEERLSEIGGFKQGIVEENLGFLY